MSNMCRITFVLLAGMAASAFGGSFMPRRLTDLDGRIVGGEDADIKDFPYQVSVLYKGQHICGGSIYKPTVIVTAAHCIISVNAKDFSVKYGSNVLVNSGQIIHAKSVDTHPDYDSYNINNDIALIFLASEIPLSATAQPISLSSGDPTPDTDAVVSGWGTTFEGGWSSSILQEVTVKIVKRETCAMEYAGYEITDGMLCAGVPEGGKDACQGDSGGPLVMEQKLVGMLRALAALKCSSGQLGGISQG